MPCDVSTLESLQANYSSIALYAFHLFVMRAFKIYSFSNFDMCNILVLIIVTTPCSRPLKITPSKGSFKISPLLSTPGNLPFYLLL